MKYKIFILFTFFFAVFFTSVNNYGLGKQSNVTLTKEVVVPEAGYAFHTDTTWKIYTRKKGYCEIVFNLRGANYSGIMIHVDIDKNASLSNVFDLSYYVIGDDIQKNTIKKDAFIVDGKSGYKSSFRKNHFLLDDQDTEEKAGQFAVIKLENMRYLEVMGIGAPASAWVYNKEFEAVLNSLRFFPPTEPKTPQAKDLSQPVPSNDRKDSIIIGEDKNTTTQGKTTSSGQKRPSLPPQTQQKTGDSFTFSLNGNLRTDVQINAGDSVTLSASGSVLIIKRPNPISSAPDGIKPTIDQIFGLIVKTAYQGALLARITNKGDEKWIVVGSGKTFIAPNSGVLELQVNDKKYQDNEGAFDVRVKITRTQ